MSERMKEIFLLLIWTWEKVTIFFRLRNTFKISFHNVYDSVCSVIFCMKNARRYPSIPLYVIYLYVTRNMEISTSEACKYMYTDMWPLLNLLVPTFHWTDTYRIAFASILLSTYTLSRRKIQRKREIERERDRPNI